MGGKWARTREEWQLRKWFGGDLDFLITLDAVYLAMVNDATFCAVVEHELYRCGQARDGFGFPKFTKKGLPVFAMRGHDVEEFVGVVARYGVDSAAGQTKQLVAAAQKDPLIPGEVASFYCGSCNAK